MFNRAGTSGTGRWLAVVALTALAANFAVTRADDPPPEQIPITESTDLDGDQYPDSITASPSGAGLGDDEEPGKVFVHSSQNGQVVIRGD